MQMSKSPKIICVSGKAQHGKDTVANFLKKILVSDGHKVLVTHYADLVKYICTTFFNWDGNKDEAGRTLLQYVGTDVVRTHNPDYWVNFVVDIIKFFGDNWDYIIIPDTRFPNEVDVIKSNFKSAKHVRVVRDNFSSNLTEEQKNHPSETALDDCTPDYIVHNDGGLSSLWCEVANLNI